MTDFEVWDKVVHLTKTGRPKAAKTAFQSLPREFQKKLVTLSLYILDFAPWPEHKRVRFTSPHGNFIMTAQWLDDIINTITEVIDA
jgi:hypothetical protein